MRVVREEFPHATSWKPKPRWVVFAWRGFGEARQRIRREASSLEEGRSCMANLIAAGWESAQVRETDEAPRRLVKHKPEKLPARRRRPNAAVRSARIQWTPPEPTRSQGEEP